MPKFLTNKIQTEKLYIVNKKNIAKTMKKW